VVALSVCLALLGGCNKGTQSQDAVKQGIMTYLAKRSDLLAMDVSVTSVEFQKDEATATVHFQAKGNSSPGAGMNMQYVLQRNGSQWVVQGKAGANAAHGANGPPPTGMPQPAPGSSGAGSIGAMPNLPPPGGAGAGSLPPGHPTVTPGKEQEK
jgi:hypothetical protein